MRLAALATLLLLAPTPSEDALLGGAVRVGAEDHLPGPGCGSGKGILSEEEGVVPQGEGPVHLLPPPEGRASLSTRVDRRDYFKGTIYEARFTRHVLASSEFLGHP